MKIFFESLAYSVGAMIGDGCVKVYTVKSGRRIGHIHYNIGLDCADADCVYRTCTEINKFFSTNFKVKAYELPSGTLMHRFITGCELIYTLFHYFIRDKSRLPKEVFSASRKTKLDLLAGLLDTDGSTSGTLIDFSQKSKTLMEDVIRLLTDLGIKSGVIYRHSRSGVHRIRINAHSFITAGGYFHVPRKAERLKHRTEAMGVTAENIGVYQKLFGVVSSL